MAHMIRKQIYITIRQQKMLKRLARARGVSEAEIIRQALDHEAASETGMFITPNSTALEKIITFALSRREIDTADKPHHWKREDSYL